MGREPPETASQPGSWVRVGLAATRGNPWGWTATSHRGGQGFLVAFDDVLAVADTFAVIVERTRLVDLDNDAP